MLCIRFIITCAIPDIPGWLATEMAKIEWARREASRIGNVSATPSPEETIKSIGRFSVSPSHSLVAASSEEKLRQADKEMLKEVLSLNTLIPLQSPQISEKKPVSITPDSIQQIPPFRPRKSKDWVHPEVSARVRNKTKLFFVVFFVSNRENLRII